MSGGGMSQEVRDARPEWAESMAEALRAMYAQAELFNRPSDPVWIAVRDQALSALATYEAVEFCRHGDAWSPGCCAASQGVE
jgi:hypothetical protein